MGPGMGTGGHLRPCGTGPGMTVPDGGMDGGRDGPDGPRDFRIVPARWIDQKLQHHLGLHADRLMWWCNTDPPNFGDWVGPEIFRWRRGKWPKLAPPYLRPNRAAIHFTAGSILRACRTPDMAVVWGTGIMHRNDSFAAPREIRAVRGPLTAARCRALGHDCPDVFGDPGIVLPHFLEVTQGAAFRLGVIAHYADQLLAPRVIPQTPEVSFIDVTAPVAQVARDIQRCEVLVSSSLHGLIVSHAFGRPCAWVRFGDTLAGDGTKFHDYFGSAGLFDQPDATLLSDRQSIDDLVRLARRAPLPDLSARADRLLEVCPF